MKRGATILAAALASSGCTTTTSFAPPEVDIHNRMTAADLTTDCRLTDGTRADIERDVRGALTLIENFVTGYRCSMRVAADGRQPPEILGFLSLVGSTAAVALGASRDVAIAGGIGNSIFTAGNNYYAPGEQTEILSSAVDALLCIQTEAVGIDPFESDVPVPEEQREFFTHVTGDVVEVPVERRYFNMVAAALLSVERVAAQRLSRRGSFDAAGVAAEIRELAAEQDEAEETLDNPPAQDPAVETLFGTQFAAAARIAQIAELRLDVLRPKLQECVVRAKT